VPTVQDTESPKKSIRGSEPGLRPGRAIGSAIDSFVPVADGRGETLVTTAGAGPSAATVGGASSSTIAAAVAPTAEAVTPTGTFRGSIRVSAPWRIGDSTK